MKKLGILVTIFLFSLSSGFATGYNSVEEYIDAWKDFAINEMIIYNIPASITLGQGILESSGGNSLLATKANNHFGIKCHTGWTGKRFLKDDDKKNECFRKYDSAEESYEDHSLFLTTRLRYASLFELEITDYKGWAHGLKAAGYATNPKYATILIDLIERYELYKYDILTEEQEEEMFAHNLEYMRGTKPKQNKLPQPTVTTKVNDKTDIAATNRQVFVNKNRTQYVIAGKNDTFYQISKDVDINLSLLAKWNDFPSTKDVLSEGDKVYIMQKRKKIPKNLSGKKFTEEELFKISQDYGVRLKSLISAGTIINPKSPLITN